MALVTGSAVVFIVAHFLVMLVRVLPVVFVAVNAGKNRIIVGIRVAIGTTAPSVTMRPTIDGEPAPIVVKVGIVPIVGVVAAFAVVGEAGGGVVRVTCVVVIIIVAKVTVGRRIIEAVRMTLGAVHLPVGAGKREAGGVVLKGRRRPGVSVVTDGAVVVELPGGVVGVGDAIVICFVTAETGRRVATILPADMALFAVYHPVRANELEGGGIVVKRGRRPNDGGMADGAVVVELPGGVIRVGDAVEIGFVATEASRRVATVLPADVALFAINRPMRAG